MVALMVSGWRPGDWAVFNSRCAWQLRMLDHRTVMLRGSGHLIHEDAANEIVSAIRHIGTGSNSKTSTLKLPVLSLRNGCPTTSARAASRSSASTIE